VISINEINLEEEKDVIKTKHVFSDKAQVLSLLIKDSGDFLCNSVSELSSTYKSIVLVNNCTSDIMHGYIIPLSS